MIGGFDQFHFFKGCTADQTCAEVRRCFQAAGSQGAYILCPSDNFFDAEPELVKAFADESRRLPLTPTIPGPIMPLESIDHILHACRERGYAVGYFESWNVESLQGVLDAAEQTRSPVILGFNGEFLSSPGRRSPERSALYAALGRAAAETATVPCGLVFNECPDDTRVLEAVDAGFNLVMPVAGDSADDYRDRTRRIVAYAHRRHVAVEAELGQLDCGASGQADGNGHCTDPEAAERFVRETAVDLLAVSVGNVHIQVGGQQDLDLDRLAAIGNRVAVPLVLHWQCATVRICVSFASSICVWFDMRNLSHDRKTSELTRNGAGRIGLPGLWQPPARIRCRGTNTASRARPRRRDRAAAAFHNAGCQCGPGSPRSPRPKPSADGHGWGGRTRTSE